MGVVLKCNADETHGDTVRVENRHYPRGTPNPLPGDRIFVWTIDTHRLSSTHARGIGLAERGSLIGQTGRNDGRAGSECRIYIDAYRPLQSLNSEALKRLKETSEDERERELICKLMRERLSSIIGLDEWEANYLDDLYDKQLVDLGNIHRDASIDETTRQRLVEVRLGQGWFRKQLLARWQRKCVVTGCGVEAALRASHIKPWREATRDEQLNPANGLLLVANLDALFDRHLISFDDEGRMLVSPCIGTSERELLGIPGNFRSDAVLNHEERNFLQEHRRRAGL